MSPNADDEGVWIHQNAWFHLGDLEKGFTTEYTLKSNENGLYIFVLSGDIIVNGQELNTRDGYGIWGTSTIKFEAMSNVEVLLMEIPMKLQQRNVSQNPVSKSHSGL